MIVCMGRASGSTQGGGVRIVLKRVPAPKRFGVATVKAGRVARIAERRKRPAGWLAVTGFYMYDAWVFGIIRTLTPSGCGELEITDVNNACVRAGQLQHDVLKGRWQDAGSSFEAYARAGELARGLRLHSR